MSSIKQRLVLAVPPGAACIFPWLFWTFICALTCLLVLIFMRGWSLNQQTAAIASFYAFGAALAFWPAVYFARLLSAKSGRLRLFLLIIFLAVGTITFTAILLTLQFRLYFAVWHGPVLTKLWFLQQLYTTVSMVYIYFVMGLRLYLPVGIVGLLLTSWWLNRLPD